MPIFTEPIEDVDYIDDFVPYKNARQDEFDWGLTKVCFFLSFFKWFLIHDSCLYFFIVVCFQSVLLNNQKNTIISPFLVKLLMSILAEGAGTETSTARELGSVWPSVQSNIQTREHYGKIFGSLLVGFRTRGIFRQ